MKFCLVVPSEFAEHYRANSFEISGLLNWARVMGGDVKMINEDIADYDVYMLNVSSTETEYGSVIRMVNPDAKIVACFDYGFDIVGQYFNNLERVREVMYGYDRVFSVNRNQAAWMRMLLPDKEVHYCPHPADVEQMRKYRRPTEGRDMGVAAMWHAYDNYHIQAFEALRAVERRTGKKLKKCLIGLKSRVLMERGIWIASSSVPVDAPTGRPLDPDTDRYVRHVPDGAGWDAVVPYVGVHPWYEVLGRFQVALDLYTINSIGRFGVDCAAVGTPCAASTRQDSSEILWPSTRVNPYEPESIVKTVARLFGDPEFAARAAKTADARLNYYSFAQSRLRMQKVLEGLDAKP